MVASPVYSYQHNVHITVHLVVSPNSTLAVGLHIIYIHVYVKYYTFIMLPRGKLLVNIDDTFHYQYDRTVAMRDGQKEVRGDGGRILFFVVSHHIHGD